MRIMSEMIWEALRGMFIGVPGVFLVLAVFYGSVKLLMMKVKRED